MLVEKTFTYKDYPCEIIRADEFSHLCGYVGIPENHPYYKKSYSKIEVMDNYPTVHGGITFSEGYDPITSEKSDLWWLGFDCAHSGDWSAFTSIGHISPNEAGLHNWTIEEVEEELESFVDQLSEIK